MDKTVKRNRGRPKSLLTLERERVKDMFAQMPPHLPSEDSELMQILKASRSQVDEVEKEILRDYKYDASVPDSHAYAMASVGDEVMEGYDLIILAKDEAHRRRIARQHQSGRDTTKQNANYRAAKVIAKNKAMLSEFLYARGESISAVAKKILTEWDYVSAEHRIRDETITARGDGGPAPSHRTLRDWIASHSNTPTTNIGKGSLD
ncbi:MAG: hypothetical protein RLZZ375_194 [Pseudomonadota bacterium]|jgi:hypothetical protein